MNNLTFILMWTITGTLLGLWFIPELWWATMLASFLGALISCLVVDFVENLIKQAFK